MSNTIHYNSDHNPLPQTLARFKIIIRGCSFSNPPPKPILSTFLVCSQSPPSMSTKTIIPTCIGTVRSGAMVGHVSA